MPDQICSKLASFHSQFLIRCLSVTFPSSHCSIDQTFGEALARTYIHWGRLEKMDSIELILGTVIHFILPPLSRLRAVNSFCTIFSEYWI